ncbi:MAG: biotin--[acetyl-CoA-carboxylase] ligase [Phycisphaeraceae bacterium]|nr:biotin--[acetyl-CoA-carboxylase] ligase [Phycisphaeraceae bacterium]
MPARDAHGATDVETPTPARFDDIDSTSLHARRLVESGDDPLDHGPLLVLACRQSAGVGRLGRAWASPAGGLWCTLAARLNHPPHASLSVRAGLAVLAVLQQALGRNADRVRLKWPNDLMLDDRKLGGVLIEILARPRGGPGGRAVLVGVGINANVDPAALPPHLGTSAATLTGAGLGPVDIDALAMDIGRAVTAALPRGALDESELRTAEKSLWGVGRRGSWAAPGGSRIEGVLLGLDDHGRALVRDATGQTRRIASAEWSA